MNTNAMNKYSIGAIGVVIAGLAAYALFSQQDVALPQASDEKISVIASFYPVYFLSSLIGGEYAEVRNIIPAGGEPHDYEPTPKDMVAFEKSDLVVLNGAGFEAWGERIATNLGEKTTIVHAGDGLATLTMEDYEHGEVIDPHVWLSPQLAAIMAERIRDGFIAVDPANESSYQANADTLIAKLSELDAEFKTGLASCARRDVITPHFAFGYMVRDYNLRQIAISGLSPEEEPSPQELANVVKFARANNVKYIFFETLVSPKFSETIAREIGAKTLVLNPLEGFTSEEISAGKDYFTEMRQNLVNLKTALECK